MGGWRVGSMVAAILCLCSWASADVLQEDFSSGIRTDFWTVEHTAGVAWTVSGSSGELQISKAADPTGPNTDTKGGIISTFQVSGDFTITVDFDLVTWPSPGEGYNLARLFLAEENGKMLVGRHNLASGSTITETTHFRRYSPVNTLIGGYSGHDVRSGTYEVNRVGDTWSAYLTDTDGRHSLGSASEPDMIGPITLELIGQQAVRPTGYRSFSALDVRYDNLSITADSITPEPCTLALLGFGLLSLLNRRGTGNRKKRTFRVLGRSHHG